MAWCTIESDPGVFTELVESFGVKGAQFEELYALEFDTSRPVYGLIFLFNWRNDIQDSRPTLESLPGNFFFANQVIPNACATQAILSILMNSSLDLGDTLREFQSFTNGFPPELLGHAIGESDKIRTAHNSFARAEPFVFEDSKDPDSKKEDAFHFVAYVPFEGRVYELDGLKKGPIDLGAVVEGGHWTDLAKSTIEERITKYSQSEIRFNLMSVVENKMQAYQKELALVQVQRGNVNADDTVQMEALTTKTKELEDGIAQEEERRRRWKMENVRRQHNYVPFIVSMLRMLAKEKKLKPLVDKALAEQKERLEKQRQEKAGAGSGQ